MTNKVFITLLTLIQFVMLKQALATTENWEIKVEQQNLTIATRAVANSDYLAVQATAKLNAPIKTVKNFFKASNTCWLWQLRCSKTTLLNNELTHKPSSESNKVKTNAIHVVIDMPWPIDDRDFVFDSNIKEDLANNKLTLELTPSNIKIKSDKVLAKSHVIYEITEHSHNSTSTLVTTMHTNFGGSTPVSLINSRLHQELKNDLTALMELVDNLE